MGAGKSVFMIVAVDRMVCMESNEIVVVCCLLPFLPFLEILKHAVVASCIEVRLFGLAVRDAGRNPGTRWTKKAVQPEIPKAKCSFQDAVYCYS